jgi:hypothetical protein
VTAAGALRADGTRRKLAGGTPPHDARPPRRDDVVAPRTSAAGGEHPAEAGGIYPVALVQRIRGTTDGRSHSDRRVRLHGHPGPHEQVGSPRGVTAGEIKSVELDCGKRAAGKAPCDGLDLLRDAGALVGDHVLCCARRGSRERRLPHREPHGRHGLREPLGPSAAQAVRGFRRQGPPEAADGPRRTVWAEPGHSPVSSASRSPTWSCIGRTRVELDDGARGVGRGNCLPSFSRFFDGCLPRR